MELISAAIKKRFGDKGQKLKANSVALERKGNHLKIGKPKKLPREQIDTLKFLWKGTCVIPPCKYKSTARGNVKDFHLSFLYRQGKKAKKALRHCNKWLKKGKQWTYAAAICPYRYGELAITDGHNGYRKGKKKKDRKGNTK